MNTKNRIVQSALKYIDIPYVWGGESKSEGGFDCSGLVYNVLRDVGICSIRDTAQGYFNRFKNNPNTTQAGALLFFGKSTDKISHVAISCGDGTMIESIGTKSNTKNKPGKGVSISKINRRKDLVACRLPYVVATKPILKVPTPVLKRGSKGKEVEALQIFLNLNNPNVNLVVDGHFGEKTFAAVKLFQKNNWLQIDGIYGRHTMAVVKNMIVG